jgi:transposase
MPHIAGHDRSQLLLLPESLDDYVGAENPVRFIEAFVEGLDLPAAGFARVEAEETGRPGYRPADLLKLYIYGYLNRIRSSRRLEAETHRNIEVIWLLRHLKPDFKTIADFRRDNRNAFRPVFRQFVLLCKQLDLFGRELLAVDGTRTVYPPETKSLAEAAGLSGCAGVKLHRQEALCLECKGLGDEAGGAVCEGPLRGTD